MKNKIIFSFILIAAALSLHGTAKAGQLITAGPDSSSGYYGMAKYMDWYDASPSGGCVPGVNGTCVGPAMQGDTYFWTAWMPNANGLPVTNGLPIVGTINDWSFAGCGG